ncbi:MAG: REC domain-containing diguanylate cyclase [Deltaproteobacteria bacterium]|nr:REC domain-containing diguanylate cyclase [Deltaproteobacteria bacterium]
MIDDDEDDFFLVQELVGQLSDRLAICWESTYESGLSAILTGEYVACLLDQQLGAKTGVDLLNALPEEVTTPVILLTGSNASDVDEAASRAGAADYIAKSDLTLKVLERSLRYARERGRQIAQIRQSEMELRQLIEGVSIGIIVRSGEKIRYVNPSVVALLGYPSNEELVGASCSQFVDPLDYPRLELQWKNAEQGQVGTLEEVRCRTKQGAEIRVECEGHVWTTFGGEPACIMSIRDITEETRVRLGLVEYAQQQEASSLTDELTGLYNRRGFLKIGAEHLSLAQRQGRTSHVLYLDLDGLKSINDRYGHQEGDLAIAGAALVLRTVFRTSDILARLGGDEFTVFADVGEGLDRVVERVRVAVRDYNNTVTSPHQLSFSIGIAAFDPKHPCSLEELMAEADKQLYEQKRARKGRYSASAHGS